MLSGPNPIQWSYQCGSKGFVQPPALWNCPWVEELSCSQCHRKKNRQFFTYETCFTHCTVLQQHNEDAMMMSSQDPPPTKKLQRNIRWEICILGLFKQKNLSKSLFKKSKVQLKNRAVLSHHSYYYSYKFHSTYFSAVEPFFKKMKYIHSPTLPLLYTIHNTHISANGLLIEWFFRYRPLP